VHLLLSTRVLIYHNARNEKYIQYGAYVNVAMIFTDPQKTPHTHSLLWMLLSYNSKESINCLWFGSFWNVRLAYRIHYSWWTIHTTFL